MLHGPRSETGCANERLTLASRYAEVSLQDTSRIHRGTIWTPRQRRGPDHSTGRCSLVHRANIQLSGCKATTSPWLGQNSMQPVASAGQLADFHVSTLLTSPKTSFVRRLIFSKYYGSDWHEQTDENVLGPVLQGCCNYSLAEAPALC